MVKIVKRKITGFFKPDDLIVVRNAVLIHNETITKASMLARAFLLKYPNTQLSDDCLTDLLNLSCSVVKGKKYTIRRSKKLKTDANLEEKKKFEDKKKAKKLSDKWKKDIYKELLDLHPLLFGKSFIKTKCSISNSLDYSVANLVTAYKNNVIAHFPKYVKRCIYCQMLQSYLKHKKQDEDSLPKPIKDKIKKNAGLLTSFLVFDKLESLDNIVPVLNTKTDQKYYKNILPNKATQDKPLCYDMSVDPFSFLPYMIKINRMLQYDFPLLNEQTKRLLNPIPFHTSNVPIHMRLDTSGLCQLLMNKDRIKEFKSQYELEHPGTSLNMKQKSDMLSSYKKLFGKEAKDKKEEGYYATSLWSFLTNLDTCKQRKELYCTIKKDEYVFDNAIILDGYSVSFQINKLSEFGRKVFGQKSKTATDNETSDQTTKPKPINITKHTKIISTDPGKKDIAAMTDGITTITYTRGQRNQDTFQLSKRKQTLKRRKKADLETFETSLLNKYPKKSCTLEIFAMYCLTRESKINELTNLYSHPYFRQSKFTTYCKIKSSEKKFIDKVNKTFLPSNTKTHTCSNNKIYSNASKHAKRIVLAWGDWGKAPNALRNGSPTPGIGIRRRFESYFPTTIIGEKMTSQTCPCCKKEKTLAKPTLNGVTRHHLLRCTNDNCQSRWWNRNVVGSYNILVRALNQIT